MHDLRRRYLVYIQLGLLLALGLVVTAFSVPLRFGGSAEVLLVPGEAIQPTDIEITEQRKDKPPPPRPPAPIEVENAETHDIVIDLPSLDPTVETPFVIPPLTPPETLPSRFGPEEKEIFEVVEDPPALLPNERDGLRELQSRIQYPELARRAGIEGTVFVQFVVDEQGNVVDPVCVRDPGGNTCEEALRAVRVSKFKPGKQRGKPVKVRFSLPVKFRLR